MAKFHDRHLRGKNPSAMICPNWRCIRDINFAQDQNFKYTLTNKKVKYASNFNDQGFLC